MGIITGNPVLEREVRGRLRLSRKGNVTANLWIARLLAVIVVYFYLRGLLGIAAGTAQDARDLWPLLAYGALTLSVLLAPALAATAITSEREQQTWETLATTQLSAQEVLFGKWLGRQLVPWLVLLTLLPYLLMCAIHGGMGFLVLPGTAGFLLLTTAAYSALGLLCSFQARRTMTATAAALTFAALLCLGTVLIDQVYQFLFAHNEIHTLSPLLWLNPFYALGTLTEQLGPDKASRAAAGDPAASVFYAVVTALATAGALGFMVTRYRHAVRGQS